MICRFITGEDEEPDDNFFQLKNPALLDNNPCACVNLPLEKYKELWYPERRALIIKVLGRSVNFKLLEQKVKDLQNLELKI